MNTVASVETVEDNWIKASGALNSRIFCV